MSELQVQGEVGDVERREPADELALGQWYWVLPSAGAQEAGDPDFDVEPIEDGDDVDGTQAELVEDEPLGGEYEDVLAEHDDDGTGPSPDANAPIEGAWLGCVMKIGSNFVELVQPTIYGSSGIRVHFVHFWRDLVYEPDPEKYLRGKAMYWRSELERLVGEMNQLCGRLGLRRAVALPGSPSPSHAAGGTDLVVLSGQVDPHQYKCALVLAKEQQLPQLDKDIRHATEQLGRWMKAMTLSAKAAIVPLHETIETVDDRLFTVSLYAGLSEDAVQCCGGAAAGEDEKLHVMQRMLFMDEECLLDWKHGGMEFKTLKAYERWLCRPHNRDRILPFPRSLVAMRVRRNTKERDFDGSIMDALAKLSMEIQDKFTYLYVRNGEQVWRISCEFDFPEMIFPDHAFYATGEPLMAQASPSEVHDFMTLSEYEQRVAECIQAEKELKAWKKANPDGDDWFSPPGRILREDPRDRSWHLVSPDWVYYDEAMAVVVR